MEVIKFGIDVIPGENPAGRDIRSDSLFEQITGEIDKRTTLSASGAIDWQKVITLSEDILQNHSKDILVCSYLSIGLLNTAGLKGLAIGVQIIHDIVINFWKNGLFPPRINGRLNALGWWADNVSEQLHKLSAESWLIEEKSRLEQNYTELMDFLSENGIEDIDQIFMLRHANLALIKESSSEVESATNLDTVASNQASDNVSTTGGTHMQTTAISKPATGSPDLAINVDEDWIKSLDSVLIALSKVSSMIATEQQLSYKLYKINRFVAWLDIDVIPPYDTENKTMLAPPDEYFQQLLRGYYQEQNWLELLKVAESRVVDFRFWLDLSYYAYRSLIGINQQNAANEVMYAVLLLVKRLKGIEKLLFSDGTPFAGAETQEWINSIASDTAENGNSSYSVASQSSEELLLELNEAKELAKNGKELVAIGFLHQKIITSSSIQMRFQRILQFCHYSLAVGHGQLASGYVNEMLSVIDTHQLESWDPFMAANAYKLILNMSKQKKLAKLSEAAMNDVLSRLTILDPTAALNYY